MSEYITTEQDACFAAEFNADVTRDELAAVYAEALYSASEAKSFLFEALLEEYQSLLEDVLRVFPKFEEALSSAMIPTDRKIQMVNEVFVAGSELLRSFLRTLARRGRLELLRDVYRQALLLNDKKKNRIPVQITTASPLDSTTVESLITKLRGLVGGEPVIRTCIDSEMIGGIIVRVGDTVYDASLATQLQHVRQQMIDRSTHEIQSRRNCFRNTEGN